jgi:hypothetical protein
MPRVLALDDERCLDPSVSGAKAARLALARRSGLPVLPGLVVPAAEAEPTLSASAAALARGGSGRARLAAMQAPVDDRLIGELAEHVPALGLPLVVRSSSPFEASGVWAGAFASFPEVDVADLRTAVRGCWASVFSVHALGVLQQAGVAPGDARMALLVQRQLDLDAGGVARVLPDGAVELTGTPGSPRDLLSGWDPGLTCRVDAHDRVTGDEAVAALGEETLREAAALARAVAAAIGDDLIEWGAAGAELILLQAHRSPAPPVSEVPPATAAADLPIALRLARLAVRFPGPLGETLVLPWALGLPEVPGVPGEGGRASPSRDPEGDLERATALAADLTKAAWDRRGGRAAQAAASALSQAKGPDPGPALELLAACRPVDVAMAGRLLELVAGLGAAAVARGLLRRPDHVWQLGPGALRALLRGRSPAAPRMRAGPSRWEPFVHTAVMAQGRRGAGIGAAAGIGAGRLCVVVDPHAPPPHHERSVLAAVRPVPALAPLLWTAAGLVTTAGGRGAHLLEVAHSLGVPAVVQVDLEALLGCGLDQARGRAFVAAIDGGDGRVAVAPLAECDDGDVAGVTGGTERQG